MVETYQIQQARRNCYNISGTASELFFLLNFPETVNWQHCRHNKRRADLKEVDVIMKPPNPRTSPPRALDLRRG